MAPQYSPKARAYAARLKARRSTLGLSQEQAAEKVGVSRWTWMRWESGRNIPTADNRERIASALDDQSLVYEDVDEEEDAQWPLSRQDTALMGELMGLLAASFKEKAAR